MVPRGNARHRHELVFLEPRLVPETFPNVLITAHQGFFTAEALATIAETTLGRVTGREKGLALSYQILTAAS